MALFSVTETGAAVASPGLLARFRAELSNETPMALSRIGAKLAPAPQRAFGSSGRRPEAAFAAGYHTSCP
jgi:hypothetical protein